MTLEPTPAQTKPKRRRFTISLRAMMILVLIVGGGIGWKASRASKQRRALAALNRLDAWVRFDYDYANGKDIPNGRPWAPEWLRKGVGDEYFQEITGISFSTSQQKVKDADLACLVELDRLERVDLRQLISSEIGEPKTSQVTDTGLIYLQRLPGLRSLNLSNTKITDAGMASLAKMNGLEEISLADTKVTVSGLSTLKSLKTLRKLALSRVCITEEGLEQISDFDQLTSLTLDENPSDHTRISKTGWELLQKLPNLQELCINAIKLSDVDLAQLGRMTRLRSLKLGLFQGFLDKTRITNAGLAEIARLTNLETLELQLYFVLPSRFRDAGQITATCLSPLKKLTKLRDLNLGSEIFTDESLSILSSLTELRDLHLNCENLTDASLSHLTGLTKLESLVIFRCEIGDAGLNHLNKLTNLKRLFLMSTRVSLQGIQKLQAALPTLNHAESSNPKPPVVPKSKSNNDNEQGEEPTPRPSRPDIQLL